MFEDTKRVRYHLLPGILSRRLVLWGRLSEVGLGFDWRCSETLAPLGV